MGLTIFKLSAYIKKKKIYFEFPILFSKKITHNETCIKLRLCEVKQISHTHNCKKKSLENIK